jgi:acetylornithine/succinyldiaminopimelate/putrescine aminotransferase
LYPITATVLSKKLASVFEENPFSHISTFGGSELGCRIATRVLDISSNPEFLKNVNKLSDLFETKLSKLRKKYPSFFINYRGLGLMMGLMLRDETAGPVLTKTAFDEDLLLVYANNDTSVCQFLPPLNLDESIIDDIMDKLDRAMNSARKLRVLLNAKKTFSRWRTRTS